MEGSPRTWEQEVLAACLAAGEGAVASYSTATSIWGLTDRPTRIEISVPATRRVDPNGFIVHYVRLSRHDVTKRGVIPITSPFRSLLDLAGSASDPTIAERAFDNALRKGLVTLPRLVCQVATLEGSTVPGLALIRRLLESRIDLGIPESDLETIFVGLLDQFGLPQPHRQIRIVDEGADISRVDFLYPDHKVLIECDGHTTHSTPTDWERDLERNNTYTLAGLKVLRFPSKAVLLRGRKVCEDIARALGTKLKV